MLNLSATHAAIFFALISASGISAASSQLQSPSAPPLSSAEYEQTARLATEIGMEVSHYIDATQRYREFAAGNVSINGLVSLSDSPDYRNAMAVLDKKEKLSLEQSRELVRVINNNKTLIANYLGIEVSKYDQFVAITHHQ
ncbi:hypothetical protein OE749_05390 [Aestuariibacter sp. AA17]|uniref:Uncharacterized protein n=1 Tax=Fluctibacter corallii TaxID=2984329 RepID=A0ABT3A641_9ALTE|nr:hypothetical protein [Aestuariibacter sp. AA17]MCV2884119.1 hypothetical protein [Aestuariibacter sp. AA17]